MQTNKAKTRKDLEVWQIALELAQDIYNLPANIQKKNNTA